MCGPLACTRAARARGVVLALLLFVIGSGRSLGLGAYQLSPSRMSSWLSLGSRGRRRAVFWVIMSRRRFIGKKGKHDSYFSVEGADAGYVVRELKMATILARELDIEHRVQLRK
jgi:hypothetical protein